VYGAAGSLFALPMKNFGALAFSGTVIVPVMVVHSAAVIARFESPT